MQRPGRYEIELLYGCSESNAGSRIQIQIGDETLSKTLPGAEAKVLDLPNRDERSRQRYVNRDWGRLEFGEVDLQPGRRRLEIEATELVGQEVMDLKGIVMTRRAD